MSANDIGWPRPTTWATCETEQVLLKIDQSHAPTFLSGEGKRWKVRVYVALLVRGSDSDLPTMRSVYHFSRFTKASSLTIATLTMATLTMATLLTVAEMRRNFKAIDIDGTGYVDATELKTVFEFVGFDSGEADRMAKVSKMKSEYINSLSPGRCACNLELVIFKHKG